MDFPSTFVECLSIARGSKWRGSWEGFEWIDRRGSMDETRSPRVRDRRRSSGLGALMTISRDEKRFDDNQDATCRDPTDLLHALQILRTPTSARQHTIKHAATPSFGLMSNSSHWRSPLFLLSFFSFSNRNSILSNHDRSHDDGFERYSGLSLSRIPSAIILFRRICMILDSSYRLIYMSYLLPPNFYYHFLTSKTSSSVKFNLYSSSDNLQQTRRKRFNFLKKRLI